jgi:hypothetical protein
MSESRQTIRFEAEVMRFDGPGGWHAVFLDEEAAARARFFGRPNALGAIAVQVQIGASTVRTSLFPDRKRATYLLPLKAELRRREGLVKGCHISVLLTVDG